MTTAATRRLRAERENLLARYDSGAMPPYIYTQLKRLEQDIAWNEFKYGRKPDVDPGQAVVDRIVQEAV